MPALNQLYQQYKDQVAFYMVYIQEAHPIDAWQSESNLKDKIAVASPKSFQERCAVAETCMTKLSIQIPPLIDDLSNLIEVAYTAWPDRMYVIDSEGRIAYKSRPGPYGFHTEQVAQSLKRLLQPSVTTKAQLSR